MNSSQRYFKIFHGLSLVFGKQSYLTKPIPGLLWSQFLDVGVCVPQIIDQDRSISQPSVDVVGVVKTPAAAPDGAASIIGLYDCVGG